VKQGLALVFLAALVAGAGCHGKSPAPTDGGSDRAVDATVCGAGDGGKKANGAACGCAADCASDFCVDGVCCATACTETCKACNVQGAVGTCAFVPSGVSPRNAATCPASSVSTCGLDGSCDGKGACRQFPAGTVCRAGQCAGASVGGINICDGQGSCHQGPTTICAPYTCDATRNACFGACTTNDQCAPGVQCVRGSCGPKPGGAACSSDADCTSGFCTDGYCCNVTCKGACATCNQPAHLGVCWPSDAGLPDPHSVCKDGGASSCGLNGLCDGAGSCARYAAETVCVAPSCSGDRLNTAGTCDGLGTCRKPGIQDCPPYRCAAGACLGVCAGDDDCSMGNVCMAGSCGLKGLGQPCGGAAECMSNFCVDGVCCADACTSPCKSCSLESSRGHCTAVVAGADDPHKICTDQGAASCGTNKKCDGAGGCQKYGMGTICAPEQCANNVYTPEATCSAAGACVAPDAVPCPPFACNGSKCFVACTADANCSPGNVCNGNSCGLKPIGAFCAGGPECGSGTCAQGVCCATACSGSCKSCAIPGSMGTCVDVPKGGSDPVGACTDQGAASCGTDGKCEAGSCQKYAQGTSCKAASCPAGMTTLTPGSLCDGAGVCVTPAAVSCFPFGCGTAACNSSCSTDGECAPPATCSAASCGLKPIGAVCGTGGECLSGICAQGVCCATTCTGSCRSCALAATAGTCSPVPVGGADPAGTCTNQGTSSCGTTGFCDGASQCQLYAAGAQCAPSSCPSGAASEVLPGTCDGSGTCKPGATQSCGVYACNGSTCNSACGADTDCAPGNVCNAASCGLKRLGQVCGSGGDCDSGHCVDGVCCFSASCATCYQCNVTGSAGTCQPSPAGAGEPHGGCTPAPPCGFVGTCDGLGSCQNAAASISCGATSCSGGTYTPVSHCTGTGSCATPATTSCSPYVCGTSACLTTCTDNTQCASGFVCQSGSCTNLKPNGAACTSGTVCISTHCTEGYCCASASCGSCSSCAVAGSQGACTPLAAGTPDPAGVCMMTAATTCGQTGACNGAGGCALYPAGATCGASSCSGPTNFVKTICNGLGQCVQSTTDCTPYKCDTTNLVCFASCSSNGACAPGHQCSGGSPGTCN